jgi:ribose 5-phosphate isomerase B
MPMKIALGSDHAGYEVKEALKAVLTEIGIDVEDFGTDSPARVDYPDFAEKVAVAVRDHKAERGVLVCGTGIGVCIAANKIHGIRAASPWSIETARLSREHNDVNVLCLPGRHMDLELVAGMLNAWLTASFEGGRHQERLDKISALENKP